MFIARERELESLNEQYHRSGFRMTILYGRRRIGKSTLIAEFIKDKKAIFYTATKVGKERNLELFSEQAVSALDPAYSQARFLSAEAVFDFITQKMGNKPLILVIDEFPYWAEKDEALLTILQKYIDTQWAERNLMMILCGSALSFMEKKVLSEKSPLFGRRTSQIRLEAFSYKDSALFVPDYSVEEKAICYGITGGVAKYLSMLDGTRSLDDNIKRLFFRADGYLYDEPRNFLVQELADVTLVNNIIEQVASGANTVNEISQKIGENSSTVLYSLERLMEIDLIEKRNCITEEKNRKKTQYVIKDHMFKFWYQFIPRAASVIEIGHGDLYYENAVKPYLHAFMGSVFESMCRSYTLEQGVLGTYGSFLTNVGAWWGMETISDADGRKLRQSADIDVVAVSELDKTAVIGECKFKNEKIDKSVYETLMRRVSLISGKYRVVKYLFFSLSGYSDWVADRKDDQVVLLSLEDLYR
ncbi:MAG: ATP-binding protein [Lachnospiraceae bacterium]|nr:ATP-binding protein [Lachnospiraceae bacterium]